ncbi:hypothetical protein B0A55_05880 [Friedmanniomyces simplex]|uniref:Uncharacterized protein n=1 Tax=Friedmanniomyces simplex TaxID=329884 RepID=A0A4V5NGR1_9PEZI|nr:hypothetical protein B0A55_05880 [Friedmanniomyces simplex]
MALATQLANVQDKFDREAPDQVKRAINNSRSEVSTTFNRSAAIQEGATLPAFHLSNPSGGKTDSADLLAKGPILITFYRGVEKIVRDLYNRAIEDAAVKQGLGLDGEINFQDHTELGDVGNAELPQRMQGLRL